MGWLAQIWHEQRAQAFLWLPVALGVGIAGYFFLRFEPEIWVHYLLFAGGLAVLLRHIWQGVWIGIVAAGCVAVGFALAGIRAGNVAAPVLSYSYYGPVEGRIVDMDRSASDKLRLTLDQVILLGVSSWETPARVRVSLHGEQGAFTPIPGTRVMMTAHLSPPEGPVEPYGFDFQRHSWFLRLGAVGYTRLPVLDRARAPPNEMWVAQKRAAVSAWLRRELGGQTGAFAAAILVGDRAWLDQSQVESLRITNLAHLLAISGLHMGLLTGAVFVFLRFVMSIFEASLNWPVKKIAALFAICAGAMYLVFSGGAIATERAFIMVVIAYGAIIFDRRAISLRNVAIAAVILLIIQPESLLSPGFQMSFAATSALVAAYDSFRRHELSWVKWPWVLRAITTVFVTSLVAGLATVPISALHFNQISRFGLIANLLSVPIMGSIIMPFGLAAIALWPLGLAKYPLAVMGEGIEVILSVSTLVSQWENAVIPIPTPNIWVLPLLSIGGIWIILSRSMARGIGAAVIAVALVIWGNVARPIMVIAPQGQLVGTIQDGQRVLSKARGAGFAALVWLENDGDQRTQNEAADLAWFQSGAPILHFSRKSETSVLQEACAEGRFVITNLQIPPGCNGIPASDTAFRGAWAAYQTGAGVIWRSDCQIRGQRRWNAGTCSLSSHQEKWNNVLISNVIFD
jgi:competence protein ComEC